MHSSPQGSLIQLKLYLLSVSACLTTHKDILKLCPGGINGDERRLDLGEHAVQYTDDVLQNCTPKTYNFINQRQPNKFN